MIGCDRSSTLDAQEIHTFSYLEGVFLHVHGGCHKQRRAALQLVIAVILAEPPEQKRIGGVTTTHTIHECTTIGARRSLIPFVRNSLRFIADGQAELNRDRARAR